MKIQELAEITFGVIFVISGLYSIVFNKSATKRAIAQRNKVDKFIHDVFIYKITKKSFKEHKWERYRILVYITGIIAIVWGILFIK